MDADNRVDDRKVDEALEETFPASDAPANTVETGIRIAAAPATDIGDVSDNTARSRFELNVTGSGNP